jgi:arylsulfatase A-like enzyme
MKLNPLLVGLFTLLFYSCSQNKIEQDFPERPNILLIVADDLGFADLGSFGGDIETPNLDELARQGIRFSRFHTAPYCAVSRAMLLSGNFNHIAGMGSQDLVTDVPGYEGQLSDRVIPVPELLLNVGYHTYITGKWHLGLTFEANPANKGFEKSFVTLEGGANHYNNIGIFPESPISPYTENGIKSNWPEGAYSTDFYTDKLISYMESDREDGKPFFALAAFTSPHWPLQVDERYWKKYEGRYRDGYESLRVKRMESLKKAGMIPEGSSLPSNHPSIKSWESLSLEEQKKEARKMELYAGMVDNLDHNIGRLISYLKETGKYENTLIVFLSDNGAAGEDFYYSDYFGPFLREHYSDSFEEMGKGNSFISYGPEWAEAGSAPFKYYKSFTTEGGMIAPMIMAGPGVKSSGHIHSGFTTVMDLAPTFYELAGIVYPEAWKEKAVQPLAGTSLIPFLSGKTDHIHDSTYVFGMEHRGMAMIRKGNWKILNIDKPFAMENFQLFDLSRDLAEQNELSKKYPEKYQEMLREWEKFSKKVGVVLPTPKAKN